MYVDFSDFKKVSSGSLDQAKEFLEMKIQQAAQIPSALLFCDNVDSMCRNVERIDFQQTQEILIAETFSKYFKDKIKLYESQAFVVTCQKTDFLNKNLKSTAFLSPPVQRAPTHFFTLCGGCLTIYVGRTWLKDYATQL